MSDLTSEKPIFVYRMSRALFIRNLLIWAVVFAFLALLFNGIFYYIAYVIIFVALALFQYYTLERRMHSWKMEFYEKHYKIFYRGKLTQDTQYSEIGRLETRRRGYRKYHFLYASKDNRLLTAINASNKRHMELDGMKLADWLRGRIKPSSESI